MPSKVAVTVGANDWMGKAMRAMDRGSTVVLKVKGFDAFTVGEALRRKTKAPPSHGVRDPGTAIAITAAIVIGVIAVVGMGTVAAVCLYGMSRGYNVKAKHRAKGPMPFDDELTFDLVPGKSKSATRRR